MNHRAVILALLSAALFGVFTPAAKALLGTIHPAVLAGLLYGGAGLGIAIVRHIGRSVVSNGGQAEAPLGSRDWPWLGGAIVAGGIAGPILLMVGLERTEAAAASLLLTLEGVATALANLIRLPLIFISGVFVPVAEMTEWGQRLAPLSPLSHSADLIRIGLGSVGYFSVAASVAMLLAFMAAFIVLAEVLHRRSQGATG